MSAPSSDYQLMVRSAAIHVAQQLFAKCYFRQILSHVQTLDRVDST